MKILNLRGKNMKFRLKNIKSRRNSELSLLEISFISVLTSKLDRTEVA